MVKQKKVVEEWKTIGFVGVDSGTLMIGDPCYLEDEGWSANDYERWIVGELVRKPSVQISKNLNQYKAVAFSSGTGDGVYEVKALFKKYELWGRRIKEVRIVLMED